MWWWFCTWVCRKVQVHLLRSFHKVTICFCAARTEHPNRWPLAPPATFSNIEIRDSLSTSDGPRSFHLWQSSPTCLYTHPTVCFCSLLGRRSNLSSFLKKTCNMGIFSTYCGHLVSFCNHHDPCHVIASLIHCRCKQRPGHGWKSQYL